MLKNWLKRKLEAAVETPTHTKEGKAKGDARALEWPVGLKRPPTLQEQIKAALRSQQIMARQEARGDETLEESMDFGPEDDDSPEFPVTVHEMRDLREDELRAAAQVEAQKKRRDDAERRRAVREQEKRVQEDAGRGGVRQPQGREDVQGRDAGGSASTVRPVERPAPSGEGKFGGA